MSNLDFDDMIEDSSSDLSDEESCYDPGIQVDRSVCAPQPHGLACPRRTRRPRVLQKKSDNQSDLSEEMESEIEDFSAGSSDDYVPSSQDQGTSEEEEILANFKGVTRLRPNEFDSMLADAEALSSLPEEQEADVSHNEIPQSSWVRVYPPEPQKKIVSRIASRDKGPNCPSSSKPLNYFFLFFTEPVWKLMVSETNKYANANFAAMNKTTESTHVRRWNDVTVTEMKKFVAILLSMGISTRNNVTEYWSKNPVHYTPFYAKTMSLERFQLIMAMFHLAPPASVNKGQIGYDQWAMIGYFVALLNSSFKKYFVPGKEICIVESLINIKNQSTFIQYASKSNHARYGIKKFDLCECSSGYVLQSVLYSSKELFSDVPDNFAQKVVKYLLYETDLLGKRHHLFMDNFYCKIPLAHWLLSRKTYLTGTVSEQIEEFSSEVLRAVLTVGQPLYYRQGNTFEGSVLLVKYKEDVTGKPIHLISTACHAEDVEVVNKSGNYKVKPQAISVFKKHMEEGINVQDNGNYRVSCSVATSKYWRKIFFSFIDMAMLNAYILYKNKSKDPMSRSVFTLNIIEKLASSSKE